MDRNKFNSVLRAVALAMGVSSFVLLVLNQSREAILPLVVVGLLCLSLSSISKNN